MLIFNRMDNSEDLLVRVRIIATNLVQSKQVTLIALSWKATHFTLQFCRVTKGSSSPSSMLPRAYDDRVATACTPVP